MSSSAESAAIPPLYGSARILGTLGLSLAMLMNVLDQTIANVSLPAIAGDLGVSSAQSTWVVTSYIVANAFAVIVTGWLAQRFGQVHMMMVSIFLFAATSLLCALAPNLEVLILFRFLQGLVAGPMMVLCQPLIMQSYPPERIGLAYATFLMTTTVGPIIGPLTGGSLTDNLSWRWIFLINVPVAVIAAAIIWPIYRVRETPTRKLPIDAVGFVLMILSVGCLQLMVERGRELDWFNSDEIVMLAVVGGIAACFFLAWELTDRHPIVDFSHFRKPGYALAGFLITLMFPIIIVINVIVPIWSQQIVGYTALQAGMVAIPAGFSSMVFTVIAGRLSTTRIDLRLQACLGFLPLVLSCWLRARMTSDADFFTIALPNVFLGMGAGFVFVPLFALALQDIKPQQMASATGLLAFTRYFASSAGVSLMVTLWDRRAGLHQQQLGEAVSSFNPQYQDWLARLSGFGFDAAASNRLIDNRIAAEANTLGANEVFWTCAATLAALSVLVWLCQPKRRQVGIVTEH